MDAKPLPSLGVAEFSPLSFTAMAFEHIVHPTDFSEVSQNALRMGALVARRNQGSIHLIHIYEQPYISTASDAGGLGAVIDREEDRVMKEKLSKDMETLARLPELTGVHMFRRLLHDVPVHEIPQHLDSKKVDLILMGTHGYRNLFHGGLIGTHTERVIRHSPFPVLAVPHHYSPQEPKKILFATDFQDDLDPFFPQVITFAKLFDAEILVASISTPANYYATRTANLGYKALAEKHPYHRMSFIPYYDQDVEAGIINLVEDAGADLVSMLTHGRTGVNHLLKGSIAEDLSKYLPRPLLSFRNRKD